MIGRAELLKELPTCERMADLGDTGPLKRLARAALAAPPSDQTMPDKPRASIGEAFDTGKQIIVSTPYGYELDADHNCDAMGCGQWHVLYRFPKDAPPKPDAEVVGLRTMLSERAKNHAESRDLAVSTYIADVHDKYANDYAKWLTALDRLTATLADARKWRKCDTHGNVDGARQWGCPDCVAELRAANAAVRAAINNYYEALCNREHGGVAQNKAFEAIERALGMDWEAYKRARTPG